MFLYQHITKLRCCNNSTILLGGTSGHSVGIGGISGRNEPTHEEARVNAIVQSRDPLQGNKNSRKRRSTMQTESKEFVKEMYDLIDKKHKEDLRKVDYQYRSLKDSITKWSSG